MKLPTIDQSSQYLDKTKDSHSLIKNKYKIIQEENDLSVLKMDTLINKMKKIKEIKIYLKDNFSKVEADEAFMKDIEIEYAEQYLLKMKLFPTKHMINKILKYCPLKYCDFELHNEFIYVNNLEKFVKVIHIFPVFGRNEKNFSTIQDLSSTRKRDENLNHLSKTKNLKTIDNNTFERTKFKKYSSKDIIINHKNSFNSIDSSPNTKKFFDTEDKFKFKKGKSHFKKFNFPISTNTGLLYNKSKVDDMFNKVKDNLVDIQLFKNYKSNMRVDLSPENIKNKYISTEANWSNNDASECKAKLTRISKSILTNKNVLNNEKYFFNLAETKELTNEIIEEINKPIVPQIEIIIKDINIILDSFPLDEFVEIKKNENSKIKINKDFLNKVSVDDKDQIIKILEVLNSNESCRIIGLCVNLIYWIIFGGNAQIQIDYNSKEFLYLKLMKEWENLSNQFSDKNIFYKVYVPLFIIICRVEIENIFMRKYVNLFKNERNKTSILKRVNAIISEIFDKHGYMNSFQILYGKRSELNKRFKKRYFPRYKNKLFATSNFMELLFKNEQINVRSNSFENINEKKNFIINQKADYFSFYLNKMNDNLRRRNLEPIFSVRDVIEKKEEDKNQKAILNKKEMSNLSTIKIIKTEENMKISDYIGKTTQDYIKWFSNIKKNVNPKNNLLQKKV